MSDTYSVFDVSFKKRGLAANLWWRFRGLFSDAHPSDLAVVGCAATLAGTSSSGLWTNVFRTMTFDSNARLYSNLSKRQVKIMKLGNTTTTGNMRAWLLPIRYIRYSVRPYRDIR